MLTEFHDVAPHDSLRHVTELIIRSSQQDFAVVENRQVVGVLTRKDVLLGLSQEGRQAKISGITRREFEIVSPSSMLEAAFPRLQESHGRVLPVVDGRGLVGLLTLENVSEFLMVKEALGEERAGLRSWSSQPS